MNFFQCLLCNQYLEIYKRGGNVRKSQINMLLLSTVLITLSIILAFIIYDHFYPGFLIKYFGSARLRGKDTGRLLGAVMGVVVFIFLKLTIGTKRWYDDTIEQFNSKSEEEQERIAKKGLRYFVIAFLPVIIFMLNALISMF